MRGASLSDAHLGFRAFPATTDGRNAREVDVERAWERAIYGIVSYHPSLVTIAGDTFHHPRVSDYAKRAYLWGLRTILEYTPATIVVIQGNHDAGKTSEVLSPIELAPPSERLHIVTTPKRVELTTLSGHMVAVAAYPYVARGDGATYRLDPRDDMDFNVLLMHAAVRGEAGEGRLPFFYGAGPEHLDVAREIDRWDVIALGDYHEFTPLHEEALAFYSGALERTSSNVWNEHREKGWVAWDTDDGTRDFRVVPTREMQDYDLGDFDYPPGMGAEEANRCLERFANDLQVEGAMVRFKVDDFPREERRHIDWRLVREIKARCLHFYLDIRYRPLEVANLGDRRDRQEGLSLAHEARSFFAGDPASVRRQAFRYLGVAADAEEVS